MQNYKKKALYEFMNTVEAELYHLSTHLPTAHTTFFYMFFAFCRINKYNEDQVQ